jgi:hypothetical protein
MRGSVRAPRFFSVPLKGHHGHSRDWSPLLQAHRSLALNGAADPIYVDAPYRWAVLEASEAVAEY